MWLLGQTELLHIAVLTLPSFIVEPINMVEWERLPTTFYPDFCYALHTISCNALCHRGQLFYGNGCLDGAGL